MALLSAAAERGNYPEAKPNRDGLKGRRACKEAELYRSLIPTPMTERSLTQIGPLPHRPHVRPTGNRMTTTCAAHKGFAKVVAVASGGVRTDVRYSDRQLRAAVAVDSPVPVCVCSASVSSDDGV